MYICKKCNKELTIITPSEQLQNPDTKDFWCPDCQKYYDKEEIKITPDYITYCPYCQNYLADCGYIYCCYCGTKLEKPLIKKKYDES